MGYTRHDRYNCWVCRGGERREVLLAGAGMGQRLSLCISRDSGRGETRAVVLLWKDLQLQAKGVALISEAEQSHPEAQNTECEQVLLCQICQRLGWSTEESPMRLGEGTLERM